jgi:hypothetical protein
MLILYSNLVTSATIDAFSENPDYDFDTALNDTRLSRVGRTTDDATQWVKFSFSSAVDVDYMLILAHNITSGATIKVQANATDVWTSPSIDTAMTYNADYIIHGFSSTESYRYWRFYVDDSSNPDEYIEIGHLFLGEYLDMPGIDPASVIVKNSNSVAEKSVSGQLYADVRLKYKAASFTLPNVTEAQRTEINAFWDTVDIARPFTVLFWENDLDVEPPLYCALTSELEWNKQAQNGLLWVLGLEIEESF